MPTVITHIGVSYEMTDVEYEVYNDPINDPLREDCDKRLEDEFDAKGIESHPNYVSFEIPVMEGTEDTIANVIEQTKRDITHYMQGVLTQMVRYRRAIRGKK